MKLQAQGWRFHRKLTALVLGLTTVALLVLVVGILVRESDQLGRQLRSQVLTIASLFSPDVALSLQLDNHEELGDLLATIDAVESMERGAVFDPDGEVVAQFPATGWSPPSRAGLAGFEEHDGFVRHCSAVPYERLDNGRRLHGALLLEASTAQIAQRFRAVLWQAGLALLVILGVLALVSRRLIDTVTAPVTELAAVAQTVRTEQDYGLRAMRRSRDEVGELVDSFNDMLEEIQERDRDKARNAERLELEVERRTEELELTAERLRVAKENAEASVVARSQFLANVSHEVRTPLNAILGMTDLVLGTSLDEEQREYVSTVKQSGDALLAIIEEILDFAKVDAGKIELSAEPTRLRGLFNDTLRSVALRAEESGIDLVANVASDVPDRAALDPLRLQQVLTNLIGNAVKFTKEGSVTLEVETADGRLLFRVRDTGIGIAEDRLEHIFEAFTQADGTTSRRFGGTGLGLSISRQLVEVWGGCLTANSEEGVGSEFAFDLPLVAEPPRPRPPLPEASVLLAVDWPAHAQAMKRVMSSWGLHVDTTSIKGAGRVLAKARRPYDLMIAQELPVTWDRSAVAVREDKTAVILLASPSFLAQRIARIEAENLAGYVLWPFDESTLRGKIEQLLGVEEQSKESVEREPGVAHSKSRVLVAEDNMINQRLISAILTKSGHEFEIAPEGFACVEAYLRGEFDIVLMDMQMPGMDGVEATRRIRRIEELHSTHIPIVALTANATAEDRAKCMQAGMDGFLTKPIRPERMLEAIREHAGSPGRG